MELQFSPDRRTHLRLALLAILLVGFGLRAWNLTGVPPGLTHDEANHGREGISILDGDLRLYYPLNYGSEPLYSYMVAGSMAAFGENLFALRLVGVLFGTLTIALSYALGTAVFDRRLGLLAAGLIAVSYWALVTSRMALRATLLPFMMLLAVWCFWRLWQARQRGEGGWGWAAGFGLFVGGTFYIYLASRVLWLAFIFFLLYLLLVRPAAARRLWLPILAGLGLAGLLVVPMFVYLEYFPEAETRLQMLDGTLQQALSGRLGPLLDNVGRALAALVWPGRGDSFLAYNIPGRPLFAPLTALLAILGLGGALWRWRRPAYAFPLLWLGVGLIPSLITGPTANTTRNIGALPVLYWLPALGGWLLLRRLDGWFRLPRWAAPALVVFWLGLVGGQTVRDYFGRWANDPDVRAAYQTTIIAALEETTADLPVSEPLLVSSVFPGGAHDTSIAQVILPPAEMARPVRWMDGRQALLFPAAAVGAGGADLIAPASADLHPLYAGWGTLLARTAMRPGDLDPYFSHYRLPAPAPAAEPLARFGEGLDLLEARWLGEAVPPGGVGEMLTTWRVRDPAAVGPIVWPLETTDVVLFTHVLRPDGTILTQEDRLDAPSWGWQAGDLLLQIHQVAVPVDVPAGAYAAVAGVYDRQTGARLPLAGSSATAAPLPPLHVQP